MKEVMSQTSIEPLFDYFKLCIPLNKEEKELVTESFQPRLYRRRQYVLQEGDTCTKYNFVIRGCLRMYQVDDKGNKLSAIRTENNWISNIAVSTEKNHPN
jgi:CRP-like cAMP-binding protein